MKKILFSLLILSAKFSQAQTQNYILGPIFINASTPPIDTAGIQYANANGINYYVKPYGNDAANGLTIATAWQTSSKVNAQTFAAGDSILFKCTGTYFGMILPKASGNVTNKITYSSYGSGAKPILTGLTTLSGWTNVGSGVYKINIPAASAKLINVLVDGQQVRMGRYPNYNTTDGGWLSYESSNAGASTITDNQLTTTPYNWAGAEAVIKKYQYIIDRCPITVHSVGTLTFTNPVDVYNVAVSSSATPGFGYFFQNDLRTLDTLNEWYLNPATKDFFMFFAGADVPANHDIKVSVIDTLFNLGDGGYASTGRTAYNYIALTNLELQGANDWAVYTSGGSNVTIQKCTLRNNAGGIFERYHNAFIDNNLIKNTLNNAIQVIGPQPAAKYITNNTITNCGMLEGMGKASGASYSAIEQEGDNSTVAFNTIDSVGFNGIKFSATNLRIDSNYVNHYCAIKDDGGGIYNFAETANTNRIVIGNTVLNGLGNRQGRNNNLASVNALYADGSNNITYLNNTVSQTDGCGLFSNNGNNLRVTGNTFFNVPIAVEFDRKPGTTASPSALVRNNFITSNISYPTVTNFAYWNGQLNEPATITIQNDMQLIGLFDSTLYRPSLARSWEYYYHLTAGGTFFPATDITTLASWQTYTAGDSRATNAAAGTYILYSNPTAASQMFSFTGTRTQAVTGTVYTSNVSIPAYSSKLLYY